MKHLTNETPSDRLQEFLLKEYIFFFYQGPLINLLVFFGCYYNNLIFKNFKNYFKKTLL